MPINAHPEYVNAEGKYQIASTDEERITALEEMLKWAPKHKGGETLRKNLKARYKKLKEKLDNNKKKGSSKKGIKKADLQAVLIGFTNSGKSSILNILTNASPLIASYGFTTQKPKIGNLKYNGCDIQIVDLPPIVSQNFDRGIVNNTDTILIVTENVNNIESISSLINNKNAKQIVAFNKIDLLSEQDKRKIADTLRSKRYNFVLISTITNEGIEELKQKIFSTFNIIRVYTCHPGKKEKLENRPVILTPNSTLEDVAEKILHGYGKKVKYAKVTGPSCKFANQKVGLKHIVKDRDIVEFFTD